MNLPRSFHAGLCLLASLAVVAGLMAGCGRGGDEAARAPADTDSLTHATEASAAEQEAWLAAGAATARPFKGAMLAALSSALQQGPEHAIEVCRVDAPRIAGWSGGPHVALGRTSHRLRNPDNAPRAWAAPLLAKWVAMPGDTLPRVLALENGGAGYVEPIHVKPLCVTCHGTQVEPGLAAKIRELYPQDQATGFAVNDFRGLLWVEFSKAWRDSVRSAVAADKA